MECSLGENDMKKEGNWGIAWSFIRVSVVCLGNKKEILLGLPPCILEL